jgi:uncharacterized membrane protein YccC
MKPYELLEKSELGAMLEALQRMISQQKAEIEALHNLVKEQDKKIIELAFRAVYAERSAQIAYDPKKHGVEQ